jgi:acetyltransferase-like isoleucine patch superfamily enzyme
LSASADNPVLATIPPQKGISRRKAGELRRSAVAPLLISLYARLRGPGASSLRRLIARMLAALEGGQMRSGSLRRVMARIHGINVGAHSYGCFDPVRFPPGTSIGRYVSVGPHVAAYRRNHPMDRLSLHPYFYRPTFGAGDGADVDTAPLEIDSGSWLGANVIILPGCRRIGRGAVVAAGAVLTRDVPDYAIVAGNPARRIRYRFSREAVAAAEATRWWLQRPEEIRLTGDISQPWETADTAASENGCG